MGTFHVSTFVILSNRQQILEERKINRDHPILEKFIAELTDFPPRWSSPVLRPASSSLHPIQQQIKTLEFVTAQSTPTPWRYPLPNDPMQCSHTLEAPLKSPVEVESPRGHGRDWDDFNLASWWDVESRKGRDYLERTRESGGDFYTGATDTTTSAYEETEDLEDDDIDPEVIDNDPLLEMPEVIIENSEGRFFGRSQGPECFQMVNTNSGGVKKKGIESTSAAQTLQSKPPTVVVTSTSSSAGWPMRRLHSSSSLGAAAAASSSTVPENPERNGVSNIELNQTDRNGSLGSVGQSIASQSTVRLASGGRSTSQNIAVN
ncbi:hypothetical protein Aperf_G00000081401 [Anoplocephala perfoliata]